MTALDMVGLGLVGSGSFGAFHAERIARRTHGNSRREGGSLRTSGTLGSMTGQMFHERRVHRDAACPLRSGQPCTLCHPDARTGPQDCPTVAIVMDDDDLRAELSRRRMEYATVQGSV